MKTKKRTGKNRDRQHPSLIRKFTDFVTRPFQRDRADLIEDVFHGAEQSPNRGFKTVDTRPDDYQLSSRKRLVLNSATADAARNHMMTRWAIRQDQNWIADCRFEPNTGNDAVDEQLESIVGALQIPGNFDLSARHGIHSFARLIQAQRTLHGDMLILKCREKIGPRIKCFTYDRIHHPKPPNKQWQQGIELEKHTDRTLRYAICQRNIETGRVGDLWKIIPASDAILHGYFEFDTETVRGVTPLAPVINEIVDTYETIGYMRAKVKLGQILGLVTKRKAPDKLPGRQFDENGEPIEEEKDEQEENWEWDVSGGVFHLELDKDEDAAMLESKNPSPENLKLVEWCCRNSLKALDIPYCWWDGEKQNFYGSIGETNLYRKACEHRRKTHIVTMKEVIRFFLQMAIIQGTLKLPTGWTIDDCRFRLIPNGVAWFKPNEEVEAAARAIAYGLSSPQRECEKIGTNPFENIDETAKVVEYAMKNYGMIMQWGKPPQETIQVNAKQENENGETSNSNDS